LRQIGRFYEIEEILDIVLRDKVYFETSGGGVTLSGGEPTLPLDYASQLLRVLKSNGIHTAIETNGFFEWSRFETEMLDLTDLILFDVKLADSELHLQHTGRRNNTIFKNLLSLTRTRPNDVIPRIPLIPGITTIKSNLTRISDMLREMRVTRCWLLRYNPLGFSKRETIGKPMVDIPLKFLTREEYEQAASFFSWAELVEM
jgi:pyruvate formate lyase activating enzyme